MLKLKAALLALVLVSGAAQACEQTAFEGVPYTICTAKGGDDIRLFLNREDGEKHLTFGSVNKMLRGEGKDLRFAMNAGMYHQDRSPVGLYVEQGKEVQRLIKGASPGNFGLVPNGVFCIRANRADVLETRTFDRINPQCDFATQSGPMLVIDGALHPRFLRDSTSTYLRNGVGTDASGQRVVFAISETPVNFHSFGRFFRDHLGLPNALFLDGNVSRLYDAEADRSDFGRPMGPIVGVVDAAKP